MPLELIALIVGLLVGILAVAPMWIFHILGKRESSWFNGHGFESTAIALGFSLIWMICAILVCYFVAFGLLLWFALPAICTMLVVFIVSAIRIMRVNR